MRKAAWNVVSRGATLVTGLVAVLALTSCGGDDNAPQQYSESCTPGMACAEGLTCVQIAGGAICTLRCTESSTCSVLSERSFCAAQGACVDFCRDSGHCPAGLPCTMLGSTQGMCVP